MTWSEIHRRCAAIHQTVPTQARRYGRLTGMFAAASYTADLRLVADVITLLSADLEVLADLLTIPLDLTTQHLALLLLANMEKRVFLTARHLLYLERNFAAVAIRAAALEAGLLCGFGGAVVGRRLQSKTQSCALRMSGPVKKRTWSKFR